jgi:spore coat polysaccharide biosynthesis protein SpsF
MSLGKIGVLIQARVSSSRLPGKVLLPLPYDSEITVLQHVLGRSARSRAHLVGVVTSTGSDDDTLVHRIENWGYPVYRGSLHDVLSRYHDAAQYWNLDTVVRITSDCPLTEPEMIDQALSYLEADPTLDYCSQERYPLGLSAEAVRMSALARSHQETTDASEREHVTLGLKRRANSYKLHFFSPTADLDSPSQRLTLDTPEDYALLCILFDAIWRKNPAFHAREMIQYMRERPYLELINRRIAQKVQPQNWAEERQAAIEVLRAQDLHRAARALEQIDVPG